MNMGADNSPCCSAIPVPTAITAGTVAVLDVLRRSTKLRVLACALVVCLLINTASAAKKHRTCGMLLTRRVAKVCEKNGRSCLTRKIVARDLQNRNSQPKASICCTSGCEDKYLLNYCCTEYERQVFGMA